MGSGAPGIQGIIEFGQFAVVPHRREVSAAGRVIQIGGRAFDTLMALLEARGGVVGKDTLMNRVWPGSIVEDNSLQQQIATLRKAFGDDRDLIRTVAGRGYQFVGEVRVQSAASGGNVVSPEGPAIAASKQSSTNLRQPISELIGRESEQSDLLELLKTHRLVTLTGTGGIGKTRLGNSVAHRLLADFADGIWMVELAPLCDPDMVPVSVALALGLKSAAAMASPERVATAIGSRRLLIVLDNCEHVADAAAAMVETLLGSCPHMCLIATSREMLRTDGECVYAVRPLAVPGADVTDTSELLRHEAVRLFIARARALDSRYSPNPHIVATIAAICRRLDGIPLAIELAAARAAALGVEAVAARLNHQFGLLVGGRRNALPRHQTLRATLDWSYDLLSAPEAAVLRRLAVFTGSFTLEAASVVAASDEIVTAAVVDAVADLVTKSLVVADTQDSQLRYRLLETTRAYALEKLDASGQFDSVARRHAEHYRMLCATDYGARVWDASPTRDRLEALRREVDNLRAALDWAFAPDGDASIGVDITIALFPQCLYVLSVDECGRRVEQALSSLAAGHSPRVEMRLLAAFGMALISSYCLGRKRADGAALDMTAIWTRIFELAESLDDTEFRLRALWGLWACHCMRSEFSAALVIARRLGCIAADGSGDRLVGTTLHYLGDQALARRHLEGIPDTDLHARVTLAKILWLQGAPEQALRHAQEIADHVTAAAATSRLCHVLAEAACPIALMTGDLAALERAVTQMLDLSAQNSVTHWNLVARGYDAVLRMKRGDVVGGLALLRAAIAEDGVNVFIRRSGIFFAELARGLGEVGQIADALTAVDGALDAAEHSEERWCVPELLCVKGQLFLMSGAPRNEGAAEDQFVQALDMARRQDALSWELRAATSLARLWQRQNRTTEAHDLLAPVFERFTEGFGTLDLRAAQLFLDATGSSHRRAERSDDVGNHREPAAERRLPGTADLVGLTSEVAC
jgi:predicted ATPase/DNA-binding winged helix-turn-helix (wHTH) protein